ncbi:site-specific integrase, partial [Streptococcus suis]
HIIGTTKTNACTLIISIDNKTALLLKLYRNRQLLMFLEVGACAPYFVFETNVREYLTRI